MYQYYSSLFLHSSIQTMQRNHNNRVLYFSPRMIKVFFKFLFAFSQRLNHGLSQYNIIPKLILFFQLFSEIMANIYQFSHFNKTFLTCLLVLNDNFDSKTTHFYCFYMPILFGQKISKMAIVIILKKGPALSFTTSYNQRK